MTAAQWVEYDGSDEQIAEIRNSRNGWLARIACGHESIILDEDEPIEDIQDIEFYLICSPHPYAAQIQQWARTGQPVYAKAIGGVGSQECHEYFPPFMHPVEFEYSFAPFGEEV